jgi:hypothetical protein
MSERDDPHFVEWWVKCAVWLKRKDASLAYEAARAPLLERIRKLEHKLGPLLADNTCLLCGRSKPCMTESDLKPNDPGVPCTFDPTPRQLWDDNKRLRAQVEGLETKCALLAASWKKAEDELEKIRAAQLK